MSAANPWDFVSRNPYNPHIWTALVLSAEESQNYEAISKAYRGFLENFPLLHIYWQKLALLVYNHTHNARESSAVFSEALSEPSLNHSVDFWHIQCQFTCSHSAEFTEIDTRTVFERALGFIGRDYNSDEIWKQYIAWEEERGNIKQAAQLIARVLSMPVKNLEYFWTLFAKYAEQHPTEECVTEEEREEIEKSLADVVEQQELSTTQEIDRARKELTVELRRRKYAEAVEGMRKVLIYEVKIRQTFFHFKVVDEGQISNWSEYLNYLAQLGDVEATKHLFERCLIPCNLVPEMWMKYATFVQQNEGNEAAIEIMNRAGAKALSINPRYHRIRGTFFELMKDAENAALAYDKLKDFQTAEAVIDLALYRRRVGQPYEEDLIKYFKETRSPRDVACIGAFLYKIKTYVDPAEILERAPKEVLALSIAVAILEERREGDTEELYSERVNQAKESFKKFITSKADVNDRVTANEAFQTFLFRHAAPIEEIRKAQRQQITLEKERRSYVMKQRREEAKNTNNLSGVLDRWMKFIKENEIISGTNQ